ncbi:magnesium transporter [Agrobacterium sp. TS43]|uniref:magnesium transporter n=1 Tax=Agrobacterium TaxID=357 RepID=UPI0003639446|nr:MULTISPECIES: magnesium transporter [Agrobacterium]EPR22956.1 magnesium transporter [Agrobacterium radiobacter DSM 30147]UXT40308.1 magnesium transporter [Agrobacterium tumefaciens]KDR90437.1 magnesium transporter [Agrobacterium tumefaciens GW4]KVK43671.1 magnesium transporter [Agrobacterium sp. LY4]KVK43705.1 magnesium transporter [Agrobacterium sp. JL28]
MNFHNLSQRASKAARLLRSGNAGSSTTIAERVEHLNTLDVTEAVTALLAMPQAKAVAILDRPELHGAAAIIADIPVEQAARLVNLMSDDRVADVMAEMAEEPRAKLFSRLDRTTALSIQHLMGYPPRTAGSIMTTEFVSVPDNWTVEQTLSHIRVVERSRETVYAIYVLAEDGTLSTVVTLRRLLTGEAGASILSVASKEGIVCASPLMSQEDVARLIRKHDLLALPVVDDRSHILGIVTVDDVIDTMIADTTEDAHKFGGMEALGKPYMTIGFPDMIRKRAGWLAALFLGEMLTASAMQHFEGELEKAVVLTLFIPLIMSSGGNSGSQATSLIIRALALGELKLSDWWRVLLREIPTGLTLGCILGAIGFLRLSLWQQAGFYDYGEHWLLVGATVFAALVGIVTFGSLAGSMLPFVLQRLRLDPASASAPFVATLVDVSGLIIYFSVALVILSGTLL